jgi:hypothetical protein
VPTVLFLKLLAIFATVAIGWLAGRTREFAGGDPARLLSNAAFYIFAPALLFRTTARIDLAALPWPALAVFFGPVVACMLAVYALQRWRAGHGGPPAASAAPAQAARPAVRAITSAFGNNAQLGIPMAAALFGETGLQLHLSVVSLHALVLLSVLTLLVEHDVARASGIGRPLGPMLALTVRNTVVHPVVLPVLAGLAWNVGGLGLAGPLDEVLQLLGSAVVPLCLVAIGLSLGHYGLRGAARAALGLAAMKLILQPALVLAVGWAAGVRGLGLTVVVMAAAMPCGTNALLFAQRYRCSEAETTAAIVLSTLAFALTAPLWLAVLVALA